MALPVGGEGVHVAGQALLLWPGGRQHSGSGWSKYPVFKCSEGMTPKIY